MKPGRRAFVDTGAFCALIDRSDSFHGAAVGGFRRAATGHLVLLTTILVVGEAFSLIQRKIGQRPAVVWLRSVRESAMSVVWPPTPIGHQATLILAQFEDQDFSLTDAVSFAVMEAERISQYLSFDHHFDVFGASRGWTAI